MAFALAACSFSLWGYTQGSGNTPAPSGPLSQPASRSAPRWAHHPYPRPSPALCFPSRAALASTRGRAGFPTLPAAPAQAWSFLPIFLNRASHFSHEPCQPRVGTWPPCVPPSPASGACAVPVTPLAPSVSSVLTPLAWTHARPFGGDRGSSLEPNKAWTHRSLRVGGAWAAITSGALGWKGHHFPSVAQSRSHRVVCT